MFLGSTRSREAGVYVVALDNVQTRVDGFTPSAETGCSFTWSQTNLSAGYHNLTVSFVGPSPQSPSQSQGSFEMNTLQSVFWDDISTLALADFFFLDRLVAEDNSPPPRTNSSGGRSLPAEIICAAVFFVVLVHILSV